MSLISPHRALAEALPLQSELDWPALRSLSPQRDNLGQQLRALLRPTVHHVRSWWRDVSGRSVRSQLAALHRQQDDLTLAIRQLAQPRRAAMCAAPEGRVQKLVWVSSWQTRCGIAEYSRHLVEALAEQTSWQISVLHDDRPTLPQVGALGNVSARPAFTAAMGASLGRLALQIAVEDADCVVVQHNGGMIPWKMLADLLLHPLLSGVRFVVVLHNTADILRLHPNLQQQLHQALRAASLVLVHTQRDIGLINAFGLSHVRRIPQGCPSGGEMTAPRKLLPQQAPVIGCTGFLMRHKGARDLIRAASDLRATWPRLRLRMVMAHYGSRASEAELRACKALARKLRFEDHIEWHTGFLPEADTLALLQGCDLIVLPYQHTEESSSAAARMAVASGVPTLVSDLPIFDDLGDAVGRVNHVTPGGLPGQIAEWLHAPLRRGQLQARAKTWRAAHEWEVIAEVLAAAITHLPPPKRHNV